MYKEQFKKSGLTYTDVAHELGVCELTARKKINGTSKATRAEQAVLNNLFEGENKACTTSPHKH